MATLKNITADEWQQDDYISAGYVHNKSEEILQKYQAVSNEYDEEGIGRIKITRFLTPSGKQFFLFEGLESTLPVTEIFIHNNPATMANDLKEILEELELSYSDLDWVNPDIRF